MSRRGVRAVYVFGAILALGLPTYAVAGGSGGKGKKAGKKAGKNAQGSPEAPLDSGDDGNRDRPSDGIATPGAVKAKKAATIEMGAPIQFHNISVVPVMTTKRGPFQKYTLLEDGLAKRTLAVRELKGNSGEARVNSVEVKNTGADPVYLLGGEMILGGKQDRIIARDTVVAANEKWVRVSVFCVEQGRWRGGNMKFQSGKAMADVSVRRAAMSGDQGEVWKQVSKKNAIHGTESATQTYRRTIQNSGVRKKVRPYVKELASKLPADRRLAGLVFGINGKIHVADIFGNPVLFGDLSEKLLSAYVLEALGHQVVRDARPVSRKAAGQFVGKGRKAKGKKVTKSGRAKSIAKEETDFIGAETVDDETGETVRETYIGK